MGSHCRVRKIRATLGHAVPLGPILMHINFTVSRLNRSSVHISGTKCVYVLFMRATLSALLILLDLIAEVGRHNEVNSPHMWSECRQFLMLQLCARGVEKKQLP
jgi:hypothetical protein